jgi:hypothetical protein
LRYTGAFLRVVCAIKPLNIKLKTLLKTSHITNTCIGLLIVINLQKANAQSLGDPVVSITFGAGTANHAGGTDGLSNNTILNPVANPPDDITYTLHMISNSGCGTEATDDVFRTGL